MNQPEFQAWQGKVRLALLIGIDLYPGEGIHSLNGCVNDIDQLAGILESKYGFAVICLRNAAANRAAILEAMATLAAAAKEGDQIVFGWSGHGATLKVEDGQVFETLVPCDSRRDGTWAGNRDITDRELFGWVWQVSEKTPLLTLIIDGCRAGSIVRGTLQACPRFAAAENGKSAAVGRDKNAFILDGREPGPAGPSGWLPVSDRYTLLAACLAEEFCREIEDPDLPGMKRGLFSHQLQKALIAQKESCTWRELFEGVRKQVNARDPKQHPQLEGVLDREVFGQKIFQPKPFLPLLAREGLKVQLGGGGAHGVIPGSRWSLYPADCREPDKTKEFGQVLIEKVGALRCEGSLLERAELPEDLAGLRAFETSRPIDRAFRVHLAPSVRSAPGLRKKVEGSAYLALVGSPDPEKADLILHRLPARESCPPGGILPRVERLPVASWAFLAPSGAQLAPLLPAAHKDGIGRVMETLETLARHRFLNTLRHPDETVAATRTFEVAAFRLNEDERYRALDERPLGEKPVLANNSRIAFRITHQHPRPLQISLIALGVDSSVAVVYPERGRQKLHGKDRVIEIGFAPPEALEIQLPKGYPIPGEPRLPLADDCLLFLASEEAPGLDLAAQPGLRHGKIRHATLFQLAYRISRNRGVTRDLPPVDVLEELETWGIYRWDFQLKVG